ncbi:Uncharacterized protein dnm_022140 [Desulfonema magnum]|uniref:Uncharacterized protein n=1 Tax=Desulfonema magnum TaxID=45655 RepID=A0A975BIY3_9BACT|nr:Uncharacterized protein dnm_022140 [Desulfonema magnum]
MGGKAYARVFLISIFPGSERAIGGGKAYARAFQLPKATESHNARFYGEKCDIA